MAFPPVEQEGKKVLASPYVYRKGEGFIEVNLESAYDYTVDSWYAEPVKQGRPCWTDPYYDDGGGGVVMVSYSVPIYDKENKLIGVITSDLEVE
jgi:sigma-B regulation protein RsbU (phosphoserine phosphatase)